MKNIDYNGAQSVGLQIRPNGMQLFHDIIILDASKPIN
jgi:hypothetical protein